MNLAPRYPDDVKVPDQVKASKTVAVLLAPRLGDSLLTMVIAKNLQNSGRQITVFGDYMNGLASWFPDLIIKPSLSEANASEVLKDFDLVIQMHVDWPFDVKQFHDHVIEFDALVRVTGKDFAKLPQLVSFCKAFLGVENPDFDNGLRSIDISKWRMKKNRVVIHPTSTGIQRCWDKKHFKTLGHMLQQHGFEPNYIVSPAERPDWLWVETEGFGLTDMPSLSDLAGFIHNSGWFVGNESGIGHLSSNLGIPTFTLTGRPTRTRCWLPGWSPGTFIYPWWIPGGRLRDRYWRTALSPRAVIKDFLSFVATTKDSLQYPDFINKN